MTTLESLAAARSAAEIESQRKSELLSHASHEIRNELSGIIGMAQVVLDTKLDPEQREYVDLIAQSGAALLTFANDLLDVGKLEADRLQIEAVPFSLLDTLEDTVATFRASGLARNLAVTLEVEPSVPDQVVGDPGRLRQVVSNLLNNALKFTDAGAITVWASAHRTEATGVWTLEVEVRDTGIGIAAEDLSNIFEAFVQADDSASRARGGTGLGLSISRRLVRLMGGDMTVRSELGRGSTFGFTVRLAEQEAPRSSANLDVSPLTGIPVLIAGPIPAGVADDLEATGLVVHRADDPTFAVARLLDAQAADAPYALAVVSATTDVMDHARSIRRHPSLDGVHVVVVTVSGQRGDAADCRQLNIGGYLTLPYVADDVVTVIEEVLAGPPPHDLTTLVTKHWLRERRRRLSVLVADHSPSNRMIAQRLLERRGHIVRTVADSAAAVAAAGAHRFDVVLLDVHMKDSERDAILPALLESHGEAVPIIAMVTSDRVGEEACLRAAGYSAVVAKPIAIPDLVGSIEESVAST